jgi:hypothetical protein
MAIHLDLSQIEVSPEEIRNSARRLRGMFPEPDLKKYKGPDVLTFDDLKVRTKEQALSTFRPMNIQRMYLETLLGSHWPEDPTGLRGVRDIILKGRQFGLSTLIMALMFIETIQTPYTTTVVIAHDAPTTEKMFQTVKRFYNHLPADKKPATQYNNKRELYWPELESSFYVGQAGSVHFGAGTTINMVHASEVPRWPEARKLMDAIMEAVPIHGSIFIESTALGMGNYFETEWKRAEEGESVFEPRFFRWTDHEEYRIDLAEYERNGWTVPKAAMDYLREGPDKEERVIQETYGLDEGQMMWMAWKKRQLRDKFPQEYPFTPEEAFISTGQPYFDLGYLTSLNRVLKETSKPISDPAIPSWFDNLHKHREDLLVWEYPRRDRFYVIGADPAEGINDEGDHDYCSADVLDVFTGSQVAHYHARVDVNEFGLLLAELGWWYGTALLCVERNNHGHAVLNAIIHQAEYPQMDETKSGGLYLHTEFDKATNTPGKKPGWPTYRPSKNFALDLTATALDERTLVLNCQGTVGELMRYVKLPAGKSGGAEGSHDDRVSSLMLAVAMLHLRPAYHGDYVAGGEMRISDYAGATISAGGVSRDFTPPMSPFKKLGR